MDFYRYGKTVLGWRRIPHTSATGSGRNAVSLRPGSSAGPAAAQAANVRLGVTGTGSATADSASATGSASLSHTGGKHEIQLRQQFRLRLDSAARAGVVTQAQAASARAYLSTALSSRPALNTVQALSCKGAGADSDALPREGNSAGTGVSAHPWCRNCNAVSARAWNRERGHATVALLRWSSRQAVADSSM